MVRKLLYAAALAASSVVGLAAPAAAQSYGSVTLSVGPRYGAYDNGYGYGYRDDRRYYQNRDWRARERWERRLRWEREREWRARAARERRWHNYRDRDRDGYRDWDGYRDGRYRRY